MYEISDLFNMREIVSQRISKFIEENNLTKSSICSGAGLSRPTLDKLLNCEVTNQTNFTKHMAKLLSYLDLTPDRLMGQVDYPFNQAKAIRNMLRLNYETISKEAGVSIDNIKKMELGETIPLSDLRNIAFYFGTSVGGLTGNTYFQPTISSLDSVLLSDELSVNNLGGFWGHLGIAMSGFDKYYWFPITQFTASKVNSECDNPFSVIPCMDNSLLILNNRFMKELVLLDDDCDIPGDMDWSDGISSGELPAVFYESFGDYALYKTFESSDESEFNLSSVLVKFFDDYTDQNNIDIEEYAYKLNEMTIWYADRSIKKHSLCDDTTNDISYVVTSLYELGDNMDSQYVTFQDSNYADVSVNLDNICMMKLPLAKIEEYIGDYLDTFE